MKINEINYLKRSSAGLNSLYVVSIGLRTTALNIKDSVLLTQESMQHVLKYESVQNVIYDYIRL